LALSVDTCYDYRLGQLEAKNGDQTMADKTVPSTPSPVAEETPEPVEPVAAQEELIAEELLVEDVSIDGMCGVY
jgi:mycofactocin precursor